MLPVLGVAERDNTVKRLTPPGAWGVKPPTLGVLNRDIAQAVGLLSVQSYRFPGRVLFDWVQRGWPAACSWRAPMSESTRKVVVTGGAGFIGSSLTEALLAEGAEVHVIDNLATGRLENLQHLSSEARLAVHELDVNERERTRSIFRGAREVYHLSLIHI